MDNDYYEYEGRRYINPTVSRDEQTEFIDNLRNTQAQDINKIVQDTHNLGTDVSSNLGGLNGATGIWNKQYVTPRTNAYMEGLKSTAQAQALNEALTNYQNQLKHQYNEAYRAAQKRNSNSNGTGGNNGTGGDDTDGDVDYEQLGKTQGSNDFWTGKLYDDEIYYGLEQLKRNEGESDEDWYNRAEKWYKERYLEHNFGKVPLDELDLESVYGDAGSSSSGESAWKKAFKSAITAM